MKLSLLLENDPGHSFGPVYHGGSWDGIKPIKVNGRGALGVGAYFTPDRSKALTYATEPGQKVTTAFLRINNPVVIHMNSPGQHPCVEALVFLGMDSAKASKLVERVEEKYGYMGGEIKKLALSKGYDGIFEYFSGKLTEIVVWTPQQVEVVSA